MRYYRPGLDVLRFIAFFCVFLPHSLGRVVGTQPWMAPVLTSSGFGLCLFFSLSAYLIATLLLAERKQTGTVILSFFYRRRILRIWPLYFLGLLIGVLLDTHAHYFPANRDWYVGAVFMAANFVTVANSFALYLWSISVEEQFYVVWPSVVKFVPSRFLVQFALCLLLLSLGATAVHGYAQAEAGQRGWFSSLVQLQMFACGILLALWHDRRGNLLRGRAARVGVVLCILPVWYGAARLLAVDGGYALGAVRLCVGYLVVALSCAALVDVFQQAQKMPAPLLRLGRISYGLYVFHIPALVLTGHLLRAQGLPLQLPVAFALSVLAAALSFRYFETPFLRRKQRIEVVSSGPLAA